MRLPFQRQSYARIAPAGGALALALVLATGLAGCQASGVDLRSHTLGGVRGETKDEGGGTSSDAGAETGTTTDTGTGESADVPAWVNASYLTCSWDGAASETELDLTCGLGDADGRRLPRDPTVAVQWRVVDAGGVEVPAPQAAVDGTGIAQQFTVASVSVPDLTVEAVIAVIDASSTKDPLETLDLALEDGLPGLAPGEMPRACFERGDPADECLALLTDPVPTLRLFVSSQTFTGNLGGQAGADAKCAAAASTAGHSGAWIAVISTTTIMAADRAVRDVPVVDMSGAPLGNDMQILLGGGPDTPFGIDETGATVATAEVWTGSLTGGIASDTDCGGWTSTAGSGTTGVFGGGAAFGEWLTSNSLTCASAARLYCLEQ